MMDVQKSAMLRDLPQAWLSEVRRDRPWIAHTHGRRRCRGAFCCELGLAMHENLAAWKIMRVPNIRRV